MAEFIFKKSDYTNADPEKDRRGVHKIGDFINYKPDGWAANWPNVGDYANHFVCIRCPEITPAEAEAADHRKPWKDDFDYEIVSSQPAQGQYTVRVFNKNTSPSGAGQLTREKVDNFLTGWGCSDITFAAGSVTFTFNLWNAVRSSQFWDVDLIASKVNFTQVSYSGVTGIGVIQVEVIQENWGGMFPIISAFEFMALCLATGTSHPGYGVEVEIEGKIYMQPGALEDVICYLTQEEIEEKITKQITDAIQERGGIITANNYPIITFQIERSDILTRFRQDVKQKAETVYKRHQYSISAADVDAIVAAGGVVTMSRTEFLSKLINHLAV